MKKVDWINVLERAAWTFAEGFLIALPTTINMGMDGAAWKSALVSAAMAGLSALKTMLIDLCREQHEPAPEPDEDVEG